ncbi:MAG: leucyl/phenylalanyl-tRNA--protein transferase [Armatimonadetes bacterium]|nr:leucyl/phenylalanyl-tRNA--protein transferase [Armatimonadota bacterium]
MHSSELTPEMIYWGYREGWFPMVLNEETDETQWLKPRDRCLFPIEGIRLSRSLQKTIRQGKFEIRFDTNFTQVIENCRRPEANWINDDFIRVYSQIYMEGWGHCAECWFSGKLVGGVYGIAIGGVFFAESMFHLMTDASKVALWALVETCRDKGFVLFDAQIMNPHLLSLGAYEIPNEEYDRLLGEAIVLGTEWSA